MTDTRSVGRKTFKYAAGKTILVTDGYMSPLSAQQVLLTSMEHWGISGTTDVVVDEIVSKIAHALRQGTSAEREYEKVTFEHDGVACNLQALRAAAGMHDNTENPVRVFARSYKGGEIAVRLYDMLKDPENVQLRQEAALDYGCALEVVHVAFDFADCLPRYPGVTLTQLERYCIANNTVSKVRSSRSAVIGATDGGSMQDSAANAAIVSSGSAQPVGGVSQSAGVGARDRGGFSRVR